MAPYVFKKTFLVKTAANEALAKLHCGLALLINWVKTA
jgi:hypothetical protein